MSKLVLIILILPIIFISCSTEKTLYVNEGRYHLTTQDANWTLSFSNDNYRLADKVESAKSSNFIFVSEPQNLIIFCEINRTTDCQDAITCLERFIKNPTGSTFFGLSSKRSRFTVGHTPVVEYFVPNYEGEEINQDNMTAVFYRPGFAINIHVSKPGFSEPDRVRMIKFIASVLLTDKLN